MRHSLRHPPFLLLHSTPKMLRVLLSVVDVKKKKQCHCRLFVEGVMMKVFQAEDIYTNEITVSQAARYLGVGKRVIYQLLEFGELRAVRERGKVIIDPCSLRAFRESGKQP